VSELFAPLDHDARAQAQQDLTGGHPYFICVGSIHPRKNIARLLLAFDRLVLEHPSELRLVIVGERFWWDERLKEAWEQVQHKERIIFTGRLQQDRLRTAVGGALALVFVSYFEGFGIPVAEAMRCGVPVVAAETTSLPEVAGDAALYCDPFSVAAITRALHSIQGDPALREQLSAAGIKRSKRYTWDRAAEDLWASFGRMCADAGILLKA
jgi:glycosyltransferase involved in cell wall biosynthesis